MTSEWTEEDKAAHIRFVEEMRRLRDRVTRARFMRVELPTSGIGRSLDRAFDRLGLRK